MKILGKLLSMVSLAIAAGLVVVFPSAVEAGSAVHIMSVSAVVSPTVAMKFKASSMQLSVTKDDIARGYIDVPGTYRLSINTDRTLQRLANIMVDYEPNPYKFTSIQVASQTLQTGDLISDTLRPANIQVASRTLQTGDLISNTLRSANIQVASRTLQIGDPRFDIMLANYINGLPPTAAGPSRLPRIPTASGRSVKAFDDAEAFSARSSVTSLGYRLILPGSIKPGNISVPLTLSLQL